MKNHFNHNSYVLRLKNLFMKKWHNKNHNKIKYALDINILLVVFYNFVALKSTIIGISFLTAAFIDSLITSN